MAKKQVQKLNGLVHSESFLQVNFIKGFKYIDKAGEVVNLFYDEKNNPPVFQMDRNFLVIRKESQLKEEYRLSINNFWGHYLSPDGLDKVATDFEKKCTDVLPIVDIKKINRLGWRNYFVYEFDAAEDNTKFSSLLNREDLALSELSFSKKYGDFIYNYKIRKVIKSNKEKTQGVLFDVDCYKEYATSLDINKIKIELKSMREAIQSADFLEIINFILSK
ncbi:hypothetical protein GF366_01020 [Candidatus Peregrinibacteria bacterium]|nr:hypothetical protein [Candidatus Peregrinibacteria bacterium]